MSARVSFLAVALALAGLFAQGQMHTSGQPQLPPPASRPQTDAGTDRNREATDDRRIGIDSHGQNAGPGAIGTETDGAGIEGTKSLDG